MLRFGVWERTQSSQKIDPRVWLMVFEVWIVKWDEWIFVAHALVFFGVFGTTPAMRQLYTRALWYIPEKLGYKRKMADSEVRQEASGMEFAANPKVRAAPTYVSL